MKNKDRIDRLNKDHSLTMEEWEQLFSTYTKEDVDYAASLAREI